LHTLIIGGGIAGIATAWELNKAGVQVTISEALPYLGGRLCSHSAKGIPTKFDNGPHLFLSSYTSTRRLLEELDSGGDLHFPFPGRIPFVLYDGSRAKFTEWALPAPLNLAGGLLAFSLLNLRARGRVVRAAGRLLTGRDSEVLSMQTWLEENSQAEERRIFWEPLIQAALNVDSSSLPLSYLQVVFKEGFCRGFSGGRLGFARRTLDSVFNRGAKQALNRAGVEVLLKTPVSSVKVDARMALDVSFHDGKRGKYDAVVAALPPWALDSLLSNTSAGEDIKAELDLKSWRTQPISSLYLWADERPLLDEFICTPEGAVDWVFDFGRIWGRRNAPLCFLLGNGKVDRSNSGIRAIMDSSHKVFPQLRNVSWKSVRLVSEKRATPLRPEALWGKRLRQTTRTPHLFLAGDWLDPELPPTVEAAVRSGKRAANLILERHE